MCPTRDVWNKVALAIENQLTSITLADLVGEEQKDIDMGGKTCTRKK
jgi:DNA-binding IscR family transcriptional regulator